MWEACPRCESKTVTEFGKGMYFLIGFITAGICIWLGFLLPVLWVGVVVGGALVILSPFLPKTYQCKSCNYSWREGKAKKPA